VLPSASLQSASPHSSSLLCADSVDDAHPHPKFSHFSEGLMSNEKLFEEMELQLKRELTPDERRFLVLADETLRKDRLAETKEAKLAKTAKGLAS
jgi:hypothetical protein